MSRSVYQVQGKPLLLLPRNQTTLESTGAIPHQNVPHTICIYKAFIKGVSFRCTFLFDLLVHSRCRGVYVISFDHTQTHTTVGGTPLDEGSVPVAETST
jgi:hypothetical protein